jgi:hypothetical protein
MKKVKQSITKKPALKPNKTPTGAGTLVALLRQGWKLYKAYELYSKVMGFAFNPAAQDNVLQVLCWVLGG